MLKKQDETIAAVKEVKKAVNEVKETVKEVRDGVKEVSSIERTSFWKRGSRGLKKRLKKIKKALLKAGIEV
jgi:uncharacterized coiled-coil DUF342 family protein